MLLILSVYVTNLRNHNRYSRDEIFAYMLKSYKNIPFTEIYLFILIDKDLLQPNNYFYKNDLTQFIHNTFNSLPTNKIHIVYTRYTLQSEWNDFIKYIYIKHGKDELAWFIQNDDHIFVDYNMDILLEGIEHLKKEPARHKSIYLSHWPEILKMSGKYQTPNRINNYINFNLSLLDSIQIFNLQFIYDIFVVYKWKNKHIRIDSILNELTNTPSQYNPLNQIIYVPLRELLRHFDGYDHVSMDANACGPLVLPTNTMYYSRDALKNKMTASHSSFWTSNNHFNIPNEWIEINYNLHNIKSHKIDDYIYNDQHLYSPGFPICVDDTNYIKKKYILGSVHYRAIILILASNNNIVDKNGRSIWKKYMNIDPSIKVFFVYGKLNNELVDYDPTCDLIYNDVNESYPVFIHKTIKAMETIHTLFTYDFFIRTNLSTFWDFTPLHI